MSDNKIPFSYDKYLSGGYRVVNREGLQVKPNSFSKDYAENNLFLVPDGKKWTDEDMKACWEEAIHGEHPFRNFPEYIKKLSHGANSI